MSRTWYPEGYNPAEQKIYYPPGPPPLSAAHTSGVQPWIRPRINTSQPKVMPPTTTTTRGTLPTGSGGSSNTQSSHGHPPPQRRQHQQARPRESHPQAPAQTRSARVQQHQVPSVHAAVEEAPLAQKDVELVEGVNYFKIGETVRVRRWAIATDSHTDWVVGEVVRPVLVEHTDGTTRRSYLVAYNDPRNGQRKEKQFSPHFKEIASIPRRSASPSVPQPLPPPPNPNAPTVLAPIPTSYAGYNGEVIVYTPCAVLSPPERGRGRVRILSTNRDVSLAASALSSDIAPSYNVENARKLRGMGYLVAGDL
ncbi:hypothetical protein MKEN_00270100 [Mycena kentingensis (nom. inval.)]|nr:hypothetical protein MKEN_00270100 [Mycena kentingensis (nom. inval.)]